MMEQDLQITAELVAFMVAIFGALAGVWFRVESKINTEGAESRRLALVAKDKAEDAAKDLEKYKTQVAETYVSKAGIKEMKDEILSVVRDARDAVTHMSDRLDRVFDAQKPSAPRRTREE